MKFEFIAGFCLFCFQCLFTLQSCLMRVACDEEVFCDVAIKPCKIDLAVWFDFFKSKTRIVWARLVNTYPNDSLTPFRFIHPVKQQILHCSFFSCRFDSEMDDFLFCRCLNGMIATFGFSSMRMLRPSYAIG